MVGFAVAILLSSLRMMSQGVQTSACSAQSSEIVASMLLVNQARRSASRGGVEESAAGGLLFRLAG